MVRIAHKNLYLKLNLDLLSVSSFQPLLFLFFYSSPPVLGFVFEENVKVFHERIFKDLRSRYGKGKGKVTPLQARCGPEGG
jgi:hypothetical protein